MEKLIHTTSALCPRCDQVVAADVSERAGDAWLQGTCSQHGGFEGLYFRDVQFYKELRAVHNPLTCCNTYDCAQGQPCSRRGQSRTLIYLLNLTNNCNMTCDACLSSSKIGKHEPYLAASHLLESLPDARNLGYSPHVILFGGEPTMHPQVEEIVQEARARGYLPRMATNGLKLRDRRYAQRLSDAGLKWICLHFDSIHDERNQKLRDRPMLEASTDIIHSAQEAGMKVQFIVTVSRDNLDELRDMVKFAQTHGVFWLSLYSLAEIGRLGSAGLTYMTDAIDALERQTNGAVGRHDFLSAARMFSRMYRMTGRHNYRQRATMVSLPIMIDGDAWVPVTRLAGAGALARPRLSWQFLRSLSNMLDYEHHPPNGDWMVISVQQLQSRSVFNLQEAVLTAMSFANERSYIPFDIYNHVHRWPQAKLAAARG